MCFCFSLTITIKLLFSTGLYSRVSHQKHKVQFSCGRSAITGSFELLLNCTKKKLQGHHHAKKKCVECPQEGFLFIKLITSFRISLLNNCKKDFQFYIKTTESNFFTLNIRFFLHDLFEFHVFGLS
jgi:hypothetical protein